MSQRLFFDTNILVYADDLDAGVKHENALDILEAAILSRRAVLSTQVLQEYFVVATRKLGVEISIAQRKLSLLARLDVVQVDVSIILSAVELHRNRSLSFWDALIVESAAAAGCVRLLTEDLSHGERIGGLVVENPFLGL